MIMSGLLRCHESYNPVGRRIGALAPTEIPNQAASRCMTCIRSHPILLNRPADCAMDACTNLWAGLWVWYWMGYSETIMFYIYVLHCRMYRHVGRHVRLYIYHGSIWRLKLLLGRFIFCAEMFCSCILYKRYIFLNWYTKIIWKGTKDTFFWTGIQK
jgi:hypothetical protein